MITRRDITTRTPARFPSSRHHQHRRPARGLRLRLHSAPGQWWHARSATPCLSGPGVWLTDCFEVVELHVRTAAQGHGLGERQLRALLTMATGSTTLLSTPEGDEQTSRAWRLYRRFGFVDVLRHLRFPGDARTFAVLGRRLPLER